MPGKRVRMLAVAVAMVVLSGAACGGGSDPPTAAEDKATAERIVLTSFDMNGYTAESDDDPDEEASSLEDCVKGNPLTAIDENPRGFQGTGFEKEDGDVRVNSGAVLAEKEAEAEKAFSGIEAALTGPCVKDGLKASIEEGGAGPVSVWDVSSSPLPPLDVTDEFVATRLTVPLSALGQEVSLFIDLTYLRDGRALAGLATMQTGSPFPEGERTRLATLVGERMTGKDMNFPDSAPPLTATPG